MHSSRSRGVLGAAVLAVLLAACSAPPDDRGTVDAGPTSTPDGRDSAAALAHGRWVRLPDSPHGAAIGSLLLWDGTDLLQLGGATAIRHQDGATLPGPPTTGAAAWSPDSGRWRALDPAPWPLAATDATAVRTGRTVLVVTATAAAVLDPASGHWRTVPAPPLAAAPPAAAPSPTTLGGEGDPPAPHAVSDGRRVVVADVPARSPAVARAALFDPGTDRWTAADLPVTRGHDPRAVPIVATPDGVVAFVLWSHSERGLTASGDPVITGYGGVDVERLSADGRWLAVPAAWPQDRTVSGPVLTDAGLFVPAGQLWCGDCSHPAPMGEQGYLADAHTLRGHRLTRGPLDDSDPLALWTGRALLTAARSTISGPGVSIAPGDLAAWDAAADTWTRLPRSPSGVDGWSDPVWGAHRLLAVDAEGRPVSFLPQGSDAPSP